LWQTPQALLAFGEVVGTDVLIEKLNQDRKSRNF
jgi:hypothetical protein